MLRSPRPLDDGTPLYLAPTPGYRRLMLALLGLLAVGALLLIGINVALQSSMVFAVTTHGLTLAPSYRRARPIPWASVVAIEPSQGLLMKGAAVVTLQDGSRLTAPLTNTSAGSALPPAPPHLGPDTGAPVPLRTALDGLDRYRRGEFSGARFTAPGRPAESNGSAARPPAG